MFIQLSQIVKYIRLEVINQKCIDSSDLYIHYLLVFDLLVSSFSHYFRPIVEAQLVNGQFSLQSNVTNVTFTEEQANIDGMATVVKSAVNLEVVVYSQYSHYCCSGRPIFFIRVNAES